MSTTTNLNVGDKAILVKFYGDDPQIVAVERVTPKGRAALLGLRSGQAIAPSPTG